MKSLVENDPTLPQNTSNNQQIKKRRKPNG